MRDLLAITGALGDENRIRALAALADGELCVCQLIELMQLAPSTVSKHMALLRQAGLVQARRDGRWTYYRLPEPADDVPDSARDAIEFLQRAIKRDARIGDDRLRLRVIKQERPEDLCRRQMNRGEPCCPPARTRKVRP